MRLVLLLGVLFIMRSSAQQARLPLFEKAGDFAAFQRVRALAQAGCPIRRRGRFRERRGSDIGMNAAVGRTTIEVLRIKNEESIALRRLLMALGVTF